MLNAVTIPALPCASINDTVDYYVALGFEITYQQERPNNYACVKYEEIELHFFSMKGYEPANSYSTCLVLIDDANALHELFKTRLKAHYGKVAVAGIPRLTRPSNNNASGDYRFNVVDPGGNWIRFIERNSQPDNNGSSQKNLTKLGRAITAARILLDAKGDFEGVAKILDKALASDADNESDIERVQAWVLRADAALNLDDAVFAKTLLDQVAEIELNPEERTSLQDILQRASELGDMLAS